MMMMMPVQVCKDVNDVEGGDQNENDDVDQHQCKSFSSTGDCDKVCFHLLLPLSHSFSWLGSKPGPRFAFPWPSSHSSHWISGDESFTSCRDLIVSLPSALRRQVVKERSILFGPTFIFTLLVKDINDAVLKNLYWKDMISPHFDNDKLCYDVFVQRSNSMPCDSVGCT